MDAETVQNTLIKLGRRDFRNAVSILLREVFGLNAISVDGPNDGGTDWRVFKETGGTTTVAFQDTVRNDRWDEKALEDAKKAVKKTAATETFRIGNYGR